jgi:serine/threonine protein kinase/serine/threonine protein phosphatase PrpC
MPLQVTALSRSEAGVKPVNQDAVCVHLPQGQGRSSRVAIATIADGLRIAKCADEAAVIATKGFCRDFFSTDPYWSMRTAGYRVIDGLHRWLAGQNQHYLHEIQNSHLTTLSVLVIQGCTASIFHVGDSRVWRMRQGQLECLTQDHVIRGMGESQLTRALGMDGRLDVDFIEVDVQVGDRFLLTTDGIHGVIATKQLNTLLRHNDPQLLIDQLFDTANRQDSQDNQSAVVIDIQAISPDPHDVQPIDHHLPPLPDYLEAGYRVDGFEIVRELHVNARSTVYHAIREADGMNVVLKAPSPQLAQDDNALQAFMREDWMGQRIDHPDVVKSYAAPAERQFLYLVQEYLSGCNLRVWRQQHPDASVQEIIRFARPAIRALRALHRREMRHQDIKPDNFIVLPDGRLKLIDLGSAWVASQVDTPPKAGALEYAAPEYALNQPVDERADQFALAVSLYELLTGHMPYGADYHHRHQQADFADLVYTPAYHHNPHIPVWMDAALQRAMHLSPARRYTDLADWLSDLERPNPSLHTSHQPLLHRTSAGFWQLLSLMLLLSHIFWLIIWLKAHG